MASGEDRRTTFRTKVATKARTLPSARLADLGVLTTAT